ncbi:restriction endonuclease subunit S [Acinetobacter pittii]|uniref:restriction endonuclease subunit S n=1 Tax=Acinetobacter pittii TaxID=48296 RepID=UPI0024DEC9D2|nr:restriction endonuclease subunit S [Acinetobacter pittii]
MRQKKLSELLDISMGRTPSRNKPDYWGKGHPWVSIRDLNSKIITETKEQITDLAVKDARCKIVKKGTLLFSFKLTIGKMAFAGCDLFTNEAIAAFAIKDEKELNPEFLYYALQSANYGGSNQAVMGKTLNSKSLAEIEIPLPPLDDQIRIAHLLGKVEGLIAQRKQHLQHLDDLLKSVFLEMFGPQSVGYTDWPLVEIKDLAAQHKGAMRTGPFGSNLLHSEFSPEGDVAVLGIDNAVQNRFAWGERRYINHDKYKELESYRIFPGDVIVTIMGTIGRSAVVPNDIPLAINTKHLAAITLNRELASPTFLSYSIHSSPFILNQFKSKNRGAIMSGLNLGLIKETKIKRPPIALQNEFAETHARIDELKAIYGQSLIELENLYGVLAHRAFKGELDLSRVPFPVQYIAPVSIGDQAAVPEPVVQTVTAIHLPDTGNLLTALENSEARKALIAEWLEAYRQQLGNAPFSVQDFMVAASDRLTEWLQAVVEDEAVADEQKNRLAEFYPSNDVGLEVNDYEYIKDWVFEALAAGTLTQELDDAGNRLQLKAIPA